MPVLQRVSFIVGWAGDPGRKKHIENGAMSPLNPLNPVHGSLLNFVLHSNNSTQILDSRFEIWE
jgi:hypothetical protein